VTANKVNTTLTSISQTGSTLAGFMRNPDAATANALSGVFGASKLWPVRCTIYSRLAALICASTPAAREMPKPQIRMRR